MSERVTVSVKMELCSDAVFGSGYSIPGGEDVAVCRDEEGLPYVKGSTWKGLLRESLENLAAWGRGEEGDAAALMGEEGWNGLADGRRVRLTGLTLIDPPADPEDCFDLRTFTSLENGVVKGGSLRTVSCVRAGLTFSGELECDRGDLPLLRDALSGIKWMGTQRSRGFGRVRFTTGAAEAACGAEDAAVPGTCLHLRLRTELPVVLTDPNRSGGNSAETCGFIPGSAIRGAVMEALSAQDPAWFAAHRAALLGARFLDAVPLAPDPSLVPLPALQGFYEDKEETELKCVVRDGDVPPGLKRARLGTFCALRGNDVHCWSARTGGVTRIRRGKEGEAPQLFQVRALSPGQDLESCILLDDPALGERLSQVLRGKLWLGADRYAGYGRCAVRAEAVPRPAWQDAYGYQDGDAPGRELYLLAVSPFTMVNSVGEPCGLDEDKLARLLGVEKVAVRFCAASVLQAGGYNRTWGCRAPSVRFYSRGSLFHLTCDPAPALEALRRVQREGLGIRRAEGFGQVLFLPPPLVEALDRKVQVKAEAGDGLGPGAPARLRRARYRWVMDHTGALNACGLSRSQVGTIQALCEKAISRGGDWTELDAHLNHNLGDRGAMHASRFKRANTLVRDVLGRPLGETVGLENCPDSVTERLALLCLLFDHSRKGKGED